DQFFACADSRKRFLSGAASGGIGFGGGGVAASALARLAVARRIAPPASSRAIGTVGSSIRQKVAARRNTHARAAGASRSARAARDEGGGVGGASLMKSAGGGVAIGVATAFGLDIDTELVSFIGSIGGAMAASIAAIVASASGKRAPGSFARSRITTA